MELNKVAESIGAINTPSVGIAGEVRCVITKADGTIKTDTGFQKNLILNQGLDFFGGGKGTNINASCAIGSGNSAPAITQTKLDAFIAIASGTDTTSDYSYVDKGDGLYRMWEQKKYRFTTNVDLNISELGLVSTGTVAENYYLTTRVLPKDSLGAPTSLSLKKGETLDIYYKVHKVIDTRDKSFVVNMLDGNGGAVSYNAVVRPIEVGGWSNLSKNLDVNFTLDKLSVSGKELSAVTTKPAELQQLVPPSLNAYTPLSFKQIATFNIPLGSGNTSPFRTIFFSGWDLRMFFFQIRFGRVSDDAPIAKTANDTLSIPLEFSWGRYEGAL